MHDLGGGMGLWGKCLLREISPLKQNQEVGRECDHCRRVENAWKSEMHW